jgi:hypothetical protein
VRNPPLVCRKPKYKQALHRILAAISVAVLFGIRLASGSYLTLTGFDMMYYPVFSNLFLLKKEREKSAFGLQEAQI